MSTRPTGLFGCFDYLDQISIEAIASWLKPQPQLLQLENYLANKILYPQTIPLTQLDAKIDLAILREALKMSRSQTKIRKANGMLGEDPFLNITLRKILIPGRFLNYVPDLKSLVWAFIDALLLDRSRKDWYQDVWTICLTDDIDEVVGSLILPQFDNNIVNTIVNTKEEMMFSVFDKKYKIRSGSLVVIPCPHDRCQVTYSLPKGRILGKRSNAIEVYGGRLGLVIDGRPG